MGNCGSRDANDPRDLMREMCRETYEELDYHETEQTGGVEHQSRLDREGVPACKRPVEVATYQITEVTCEQDDSGVLRVPAGEWDPCKSFSAPGCPVPPTDPNARG